MRVTIIWLYGRQKWMGTTRLALTGAHKCVISVVLLTYIIRYTIYVYEMSDWRQWHISLSFWKYSFSPSLHILLSSVYEKKCVILDFGHIILFIRRQLRNTSQNNDALCFDFFSNHVCDFGFETIYHVQNSCADKINEIINNFPKSIFLVLSDAGWFSRIKKKKFGASFLRFLNNELKKEKYCRFLRN